ncbi:MULTISPECIES: TetR/AcrR family transcriptional regulator [unclassified Nocardioides]|uniref:TetR/AcrR family transcriptional regulator n=1 Tax=unclassified Nocardioides TaxID=2615069 RepID=UPI0030158195
MARQRASSADEVRRRLVEAAVRALRELTPADLLSAIGSRELARRAEVSSTSLFYHFGSMEAFADEVVGRVFDPDQLPKDRTHALIGRVRAGVVPLPDLLELHRQELGRLSGDPELRVRLGLWALGGGTVDGVYAAYLAELDRLLAALVGPVFEGWGRELRSPYDMATFVATQGALLTGSAIRHVVDPGVSRPEVFARAAGSLSVVAVGPVGDRREVDDRLAEVNYYADRAAVVAPSADGRRERTRARILEAASVPLAERGYDGVTLAQVARAAGVSASTLAHHFPTKAALAAAVFRHAVAGHLAGLPTDPTTPAGDRLADVVAELARAAGTYVGVAAPYLAEATAHDPRHEGDPVVTAVRALVEELAAADRLRTSLAAAAVADLLVVTTVSQVVAAPSQDLVRLAHDVVGLVVEPSEV